jgi:hypothetical protein
MDSVKIGVNAVGALRRLLGIPRGQSVIGALHVGHAAHRVWNTTPAISLPARFAGARERAD